uniref:Uncharacterized protein n=1 Tax=Echinococcus canadensis TaxID=519352 RepID=A0A915ETH4_9CEST
MPCTVTYTTAARQATNSAVTAQQTTLVDRKRTIARSSTAAPPRRPLTYPRSCPPHPSHPPVGQPASHQLTDQSSDEEEEDYQAGTTRPRQTGNPTGRGVRHGESALTARPTDEWHAPAPHNDVSACGEQEKKARPIHHSIHNPHNACNVLTPTHTHTRPFAHWATVRGLRRLQPHHHPPTYWHNWRTRASTPQHSTTADRTAVAAAAQPQTPRHQIRQRQHT